MADPSDHAAILRSVATTSVIDARAAWRDADRRPGEATLRAALRACTFAARALRRASEHYPDEERQMIAQAMMIGEVALRMRLRLVSLLEHGADPGA